MNVEIPPDFIAVAVGELECPRELALRVLGDFVRARAWAELEREQDGQPIRVSEK